MAAIPASHTYPAGLGAKGAGYVDEQTVSCGNLFVAKNPEVRGHDNECDYERNKRFVLAFGVTAAGVLLGGIAFAISRVRAYRAASMNVERR